MTNLDKNGKWETTKKRSRWHFDPAQPSTENDFLHVCRFEGDWQEDIKNCRRRSKDFRWVKNEEKFSGEIQDLVNSNADPGLSLFSSARIDDMPVLKKMVDYLKLERCETRFHDQTTGQMVHWHLDIFSTLDKFDDTENSVKLPYGKAGEAQRFTVMLDDWKHGQVFAIGNTYFHQWKKGDCITWNWKHMPHATGNLGWEVRPLLQITGWMTTATIQILHNSSKDNIIKL